jgi:hypothetical protein
MDGAADHATADHAAVVDHAAVRWDRGSGTDDHGGHRSDDRR